MRSFPVLVDFNVAWAATGRTLFKYVSTNVFMPVYLLLGALDECSGEVLVFIDGTHAVDGSVFVDQLYRLARYTEAYVDFGAKRNEFKIFAQSFYDKSVALVAAVIANSLAE